MVGKGTYMGECMGASSLGAGHQGGHRIKVVPTFLGDDNGSKQIDKWGRALPRSRGVRVHLPRQRARHAQQQNNVQATRTLKHLSTLC